MMYLSLIVFLSEPFFTSLSLADICMLDMLNYEIPFYWLLLSSHWKLTRLALFFNFFLQLTHIFYMETTKSIYKGKFVKFCLKIGEGQVLWDNFLLKYAFGPYKYGKFGFWSLVKKNLKSIHAKFFVF